MPSIADKLGFLSASETAALLKISPDSLKKLVQEGRILYVTTPLGRLYVESEIAEFAKTFTPPRRGRKPKHQRRRRTHAGETDGQPASGQCQCQGGETR